MVKKTPLAFLFLLSVFSARAQNITQFPVDTVTGSVNLSLPFDRPFVLKLTGENAKSVYTGLILEFKIKKGRKILRTVDATFLHRDTIPHPLYIRDTIQTADITPRKNGVDLYIRPLPPDRNIAIMLAHHFDGVLLSELFHINEQIYTQDAHADDRIVGLYRLVREQITGYYDVPASVVQGVTFFAAHGWTGLTIAANYRAFYQQSLQTHYNNIATLHNATAASFTLADLRLVAGVADGARLSSTELPWLVSIVDRGLSGSVLLGTVPLSKDFSRTAANTWELDKRLSNLVNSITNIDKILQFVEVIQLRSADPGIVRLKAACLTFKTELATNKAILKTAYDGIVEGVNNEANLTYTAWAFGNNEITDLKVRGAYQLIPDIGIVNIFGIGNNENENIVRPYIGASIYLRPVDKSIPFRYLDKRFLHRFSFNIGLTTGKIEQGEFSDFYNSVSMLLGCNYKITREFSISMGTAFLKRANVNPAIEDKVTTLNPYIGLSFDVDFTNSIQKLTGKLF